MALRKLVAYFLTLFITSGFSSKCAGSINEQFIQKIDHEKNDTARIKRMLEYANYLSKTNKDSSNKYILYIKQQASKINYFKGVIDCYLELGANYSFDFIFDMADSIYNEAIIYSKKYGAYALPTLTNNLANVYTGQHKYDQAQNILFENLKVAENKKDTLLMIDCIMGIGGVYLEAADYKNAQTYINKLQTIINKTAQLSENDHKKYHQPSIPD